MVLMSASLIPVPATDDRPAGKVVQSIALHAVISAFMYVLVPFFLPTMLLNSGIRNGLKGLWGAILGAAAILVAFTAFNTTPTQFASQFAGILRLVLEVGIPVAVVLPLVRKRTRFGIVVLVALGTSALGFLTTEFVMRDFFAYSPFGSVVKIFREVAASTLARTGPQQTAEQIEIMKRAAEVIAGSYMPALLALLTATTFIVSMVLLPRIPSGRETGESYLFRNLGFPDWMLFAFVAAGLSPLAPGITRVIGLNVLVLLVFLYTIQGLAIFRSLLLTIGLGAMGTASAFGLLGLLTPYGIAPFVLFLAGLFDSFFDFRHFKRKDDSDESDLG